MGALVTRKITGYNCINCGVDTTHKSGVCKKCRTVICNCGKKFIWRTSKITECCNCIILRKRNRRGGESVVLYPIVTGELHGKISE